MAAACLGALRGMKRKRVKQIKVGLIDVDARKKVRFPNLALMRISAYHKACGDEVEWCQPPLITPWYDLVYMSKVFSEEYSPDMPEPLNSGKVIKGGTGYCISLGADGREHFDQSKNAALPPEIERCFPDYSIYPQFDYALSMTSRGCPRGCGFCHVVSKEGRCAVKVADVRDFWNGQGEIKILDPNITACKDKRDLMGQYLETGAVLDFTQGLDIRLLDDEDIRDLRQMRLGGIHFAWDNPKEDLRDRFLYYSKNGKHNRHGHLATVYVLTNYERCSVEEHIERALFRIYALRDMKYNPYVMIYDKTNAPDQIRKLQRWCNNKIIFGSVPKFEDYSRKIG